MSDLDAELGRVHGPRVRPRRRRPGAPPPVVRLGAPRGSWRDVYYRFLVLPWSAFLASLVGLYGVLNLGYAIMFLVRPGCVANARPWSLLDAFFFSIETMSTVGYGEMYPATIYGHAIAAIDVVTGVLLVPLATGLMIAKFTLPAARVLFSRNMVISRFNGVPTLMFRAANIRDNQIIEARMKLTLLRDEESDEGQRFRRMVDVPLVREASPFFALSWTVMHTIDEASPLAGMGPDDCQAQAVQLVAVLTGIDGTTSSVVYARHGYAATEIVFDRVFEDVVEVKDDGTVKIDYRRFHTTRDAA
ncbi:MAG: ATP-sensitive inward rectifier potassium channel 10 [Alphaproteobacteria bacterium]|nr:ATP-sensitive inward rectifier potassium channel 10 [Alphaproteobacteria bacterium]